MGLRYVEKLRRSQTSSYSGPVASEVGNLKTQRPVRDLLSFEGLQMRKLQIQMIRPLQSILTTSRKEAVDSLIANKKFGGPMILFSKFFCKASASYTPTPKTKLVLTPTNPPAIFNLWHQDHGPHSIFPDGIRKKETTPHRCVLQSLL